MQQLNLEQMSEVKGGFMTDITYHVLMFIAACISAGLTDIRWTDDGDLLCS